MNPATGVRSRLPSPARRKAATTPAGRRTLYFARPGFHRNVTKRYTGGTTRRIWKYQTGAAEAVELTGDYRGESHSPMWWNGRVYFVNDRDGTMNVWSMTESGGDVRQHTGHSGWDVMHPSLDQGKIVYQCGADLWLYDIAADRATRLDITLATDLDQLRDRWVRDPMASLSSAHLSPAGDRIALTSRGRVFVAPVKQGRLVQASRQDSVRFRDVAFLPDGRSLVGLSDATGELEFVRLPANGVGPAERLTRNGAVLRFAGVPSPDGRYLAYDDNNNDLWVLELATGRERRVSENREGVSDRSWSPDGKWLAFTMAAANSFNQIKLYNVDDGRTVALTSDRVNSSDAAWDPKGEFLYFLSDRNLQTLVGAPWGNRQPEPYFDRSIEVYQVALRKGLRSPFQPDDELMKPPGRPDTSKAVRVDVDGLTRRIRKVPVPSGNYSWLAVNGEALFATSRTTGVGATTNLVAWKIGNETAETLTLAEGIRSPELSANGEEAALPPRQHAPVADAKAAGSRTSPTPAST
ncbi:MAG: hypothetical protein R2882_01235 [Gemmatimonadales bacterium]